MHYFAISIIFIMCSFVGLRLVALPDRVDHQSVSFQCQVNVFADTLSKAPQLVSRSDETDLLHNERINRLRPKSLEDEPRWREMVRDLYGNQCAISGRDDIKLFPFRFVLYLGEKTLNMSNSILIADELVRLILDHKIYIDPETYQVHSSHILLKKPFTDLEKNKWISDLEGKQIKLLDTVAIRPDPKILQFRKVIFNLAEFYRYGYMATPKVHKVPPLDSALGQQLLQFIKMDRLLFLIILRDPRIEALLQRAGYFSEGVD